MAGVKNRKRSLKGSLKADDGLMEYGTWIVAALLVAGWLTKLIG